MGLYCTPSIINHSFTSTNTVTHPPKRSKRVCRDVGNCPYYCPDLWLLRLWLTLLSSLKMLNKQTDIVLKNSCFVKKGPNNFIQKEFSAIYCPDLWLINKVTIHQSCGEVSLIEQGTIELN